MDQNQNQNRAASATIPNRCVPAFSGFVLACVLAFTLQICFFSPISPAILEVPPPSSASHVPRSNHLERVVKVGEGLLEQPEDVALDKEGTLYTATRDGWIRRLPANGSWQNWKMVGGHTLLGITTTKDGAIVACDSEKGLLKIADDGVTLLASHLNGSKIRFADDVIEAWDGSLYFSVASYKFDLDSWFLDILEAKPHGQLLKYEPSLGETSIVLDDLGFANGVALSRDQDFLVVCETWKFRCLKHWLKGESKGKTEIFIKDLPGAPDNVNLAPDGSFWIALLQLTTPQFEFVHSSKATKHLLAAFPRLIRYVIGVHNAAMVAKVSADGEMIRILEDATGKVMSFVTSALEFENHLYLGNLNSNFIGKLPLEGVV